MALEPTTLRTLGAAIRLGSFAAAGRELGYTASAVSQQMAGLERSLGLQLFERHARSVAPTEAAQYLFERSAELLGLVDQLEADVARLAAGQAGRLRIGSFASAGGPIVAQVIARFLVRRRDVEISLDEGEPHELFPRVLEGDLDVALGFRYDLVPTRWPQEVVLTELMVEDLYVIAPRRHRLAHADAVDVGDLAAERWIANREDTAASRCLVALAEQEGFSPRIAFRSNSFGTVRGFVSAGLGVALIPGLAHEPDDEIVTLPVSRQLPRRQIVAATRRVHDNPLTSAFLAAVRHVTAGLPVRDL
ncbi:LysR family transcriptional regulator [Krasilnikoviella flava]|uniref:DNA-binding transcriptional regulator, LysR family n=1 Tax=Krasilnikoviella flava TaxID=526729 RepID=A0A1T5L4J3_9MICO|nr:LysR family transcriptional regulator [Krasilnikoviella flava]SKC70820.1 DNA-binding transcriptional regulator, LysR family [Krasilnikoviella flava]